jgi:hypothetical protein
MKDLATARFKVKLSDLVPPATIAALMRLTAAEVLTLAERGEIPCHIVNGAVMFSIFEVNESKK